MSNDKDKDKKKVELHDLEVSANESKVKGGKGFSKALGALGLKSQVIQPLNTAQIQNVAA